jgi:hypothetical protein
MRYKNAAELEWERMNRLGAKISAADLERMIQDAGRRLVGREMGHCVSSLVYTLATAYGQSGATGDIAELSEQAFELSTAIPDYISAAEEDDAELIETTDGFWNWRKGDEEGEANYDDQEEAARAYCDDSRTEPHEREVYEHWIVSRWMADKLEAHGEKVDRDFAGLIVWARTTTGQAILLDGVIRDIVIDLGWHKADPA